MDRSSVPVIGRAAESSESLTSVGDAPVDAHIAIVLAGRGSERLGGADKAMVEFEGGTLLDRVLDATIDAHQVVVVGPPRPTSRAVTWCEEQPIGGGPVAAFAAGLSAADSSDAVLLLACDLPFIANGIPSLLAALSSGTDAALLVDDTGRANYLASAWRRSSAEAQLRRLGDPVGLAMRRLLYDLTIAEVRDTDGWGFDCDTWEALDLARRRGAKRTS